MKSITELIEDYESQDQNWEKANTMRQILSAWNEDYFADDLQEKVWDYVKELDFCSEINVSEPFIRQISHIGTKHYDTYLGLLDRMLEKEVHMKKEIFSAYKAAISELNIYFDKANFMKNVLVKLDKHLAGMDYKLLPHNHRYLKSEDM